MKKESLTILSSKSNDCTTKSKFTDKFEENSKPEYESSVSENSLYNLSQNINGLHVLIISDDSALCKIISDSLSHFDTVCEYAAAGDHAISQCDTLPVDYYSAIFIGDLTTDDEGIHTAEILKGRLHISAPIIAVSSMQCSDPYIDAYLPLTPDEDSVAEMFYKAVNGSLAISKEKAMARLGNRQDLYDKYYNRFKENYINSADELRYLLQKENYEEAYRLAHSIKGLSGTLGLTDIYNISSMLSSALHNREAAGELYLNDLEAALNKLLP